MDIPALTDPKIDFPIKGRKFEVGVGLRHFSGKVFEFDNDFKIYRKNKELCLEEDISRYVLSSELSNEQAHILAKWIANQLITENPALFNWLEAGRLLHCNLTGEKVNFSPDFPLEGLHSLCMQTQEDLAFVRVQDGRDRVTYLHVCSPNYWSPAEKLGRTFIDVHKPVPGMQIIFKNGNSILEAIMSKGPFLRFGWGITTDRKLNHHSVPPKDIALSDWKGRTLSHFSGESSEDFTNLYLRVERQVLWPIAEAGGYLFTIRTYFIPLSDVRNNSDWRENFLGSLTTMPVESRKYKGLSDAGVDWLVDQFEI